MGNHDCLPGVKVPGSNCDGKEHDNDSNEGSFGAGHGCVLLYEGSNIDDRADNYRRAYIAFFEYILPEFSGPYKDTSHPRGLCTTDIGEDVITDHHNT